MEDDGRGIDWAGIASKAALLGLPTRTQQDLTQALFSDGVSTRDEVTAISGRGVGTAAVAAAIREHSGTIAVHSVLGQGTRFTITLPTSVPELKRSA